MRVLASLSLAVFLFVSLAAFAGDEKANFSGQWSLDNEKSQLGEGGRWAAKKLKISQEGNNLSIERTVTGRNDEDFTVTEKLTLDGKECENTMFNMPRKSTANWSQDSKSLTISSKSVFERDGNRMEITNVETLKLSEDGNSLSINSTSQSPRGERKITYVYDKEK